MTDKLPRRQLGSTGLNVPVLGFGASPLGGIYNLASPLFGHMSLPASCRFDS